MTIFRKKLLINSGIIFTIIVLVSVVLYIVISKFNSINSEILYYKEKAHASQKEINEFSSLKTDSVKAEAALLLMRKVTPLRDDLFMFRADMEKIASKNSLRSIFSFRNDTPGSENTLGYYNFNMTVEGDFDDILAFMKDVEGSLYLLELNQSLIKGSGNNTSGQFDGKIFYAEEVKNSINN